MNNTIFKNVSNLTDEEIEKYPVWFNISRYGMIFANGNVVRRSVAEELGLKLLACDYGADATMYGFNPRIQKFIDILEEKYGNVEMFKDVLGFSLKLSFKANEKECIYYIGTGNNGQEISLGMYLESLDVLDIEEFKNILCGLDKEMLGYIKKCNLDKYC